MQREGLLERGVLGRHDRRRQRASRLRTSSCWFSTSSIALSNAGRTLALWSIGVGLFGFLCCSYASPVGLILGVIALVKVRPESKNLAWAGLIIGIISLLANVGVAILFAMRPELNPLNDLLKNLPQP